MNRLDNLCGGCDNACEDMKEYNPMADSNYDPKYMKQNGGYPI